MRDETTQEMHDFLSVSPGFAQLASEDGRVFEIESIRYLATPLVKGIAEHFNSTGP